MLLSTLVWSPSLALMRCAHGQDQWFTIGDPHSLAMGWFILNFILFITGASFVIRAADHASGACTPSASRSCCEQPKSIERAEKRQAEAQARLDGLSAEIDEGSSARRMRSLSGRRP